MSQKTLLNTILKHVDEKSNHCRETARRSTLHMTMVGSSHNEIEKKAREKNAKQRTPRTVSGRMQLDVINANKL